MIILPFDPGSKATEEKTESRFLCVICSIVLIGSVGERFIGWQVWPKAYDLAQIIHEA
jgi:hypothetical protein